MGTQGLAGSGIKCSRQLGISVQPWAGSRGGGGGRGWRQGSHGFPQLKKSWKSEPFKI